MLAGGLDIWTLAALLGHADASITLRQYAYLLADAPERARRVMDEMMAVDEDQSDATAAGESGE